MEEQKPKPAIPVIHIEATHLVLLCLVGLFSMVTSLLTAMLVVLAFSR